jgi:PAS domain S-box-containing protein
MEKTDVPEQEKGQEKGEGRVFESEVNRAILNTVLDGIITIDSEATVTSFNPSAERIFGYSKAEVIGKNVNMLMPEPYHTEHNTYLKNYLTTGKKKVIGIGREVRGRKKDGSEFPLDLAVTEMLVDGRRMFTGIIRDITEKKKVEAELRESEAKFRTLSEGALIGIYLIQDMRYTYVNPEFAEMLGYSRAELTGMENMLECVFPEQREAARQGIEKIINGQESVGYQGSWLRKDGDPVEVEGKAAFTIFNGRPAILGTALDVTQRKYLEKQRADFLAMITHDFKSPLTSILGNAELISMMKQGSADQETADMAADIVRSGERLRSLVEDFLVHSRLNSGGLSSELAFADVREILKELVKDFENQARKKGQTLITEFAQDVPAINLDVTLVQRAVSNLLQNAVNYTPEGGRISLKTQRAENGGRAYLVISVEDSGIGIPASEQPKIFQKYYRMSRTSRTGGTGLGLAIVKAVADAHNGRIELTSREGAGSTFKLFIPEDLNRD